MISDTYATKIIFRRRGFFTEVQILIPFSRHFTEKAELCNVFDMLARYKFWYHYTIYCTQSQALLKLFLPRWFRFEVSKTG